VHEVKEIEKKLKYPVVVKPTFLGSSIGVKRANDSSELFSALLYAMKFGDSAVIEPLLENFVEINCACYIDQEHKLVVSPCERPIGKSSVLSFEDKYRAGEREFPANIPVDQSEKIQAITKKVYKELGFSGIIRIDFFVHKGEIYLNEINTVPGSLAYYLFCSTFKEFSKILTSLIIRAEELFARKETLVKKYSSSVLELKGVKTAKRL
jgi:D-alanine-D-alanine ligase